MKPGAGYVLVTAALAVAAAYSAIALVVVAAREMHRRCRP